MIARFIRTLPQEHQARLLKKLMESAEIYHDSSSAVSILGYMPEGDWKEEITTGLIKKNYLKKED